MSDHERDMDRISVCWQNNGFHVDKAGPCFDSHAEAIAWRDRSPRQQLDDFVAEYGYVPDYLKHALKATP